MLERPEPLDKLAEIDNRAKRRDRDRRRAERRRDGESFGLPAARVRDLEHLLAARYGDHLPDDDAGIEDFEILVIHVRGLRGDASRNIAKRAARFCPWLTEAELEAVKLRAARELPMSAVELGKLERLTTAERLACRITTIRPFDKSAEQLERERRDRQNAKRHKQSRDEYEGKSITKAAPWKADGISKSQWYRRRQKMAENTE